MGSVIEISVGHHINRYPNEFCYFLLHAADLEKSKALCVNQYIQVRIGRVIAACDTAENARIGTTRL